MAPRAAALETLLAVARTVLRDDEKIAALRALLARLTATAENDAAAAFGRGHFSADARRQARQDVHEGVEAIVAVEAALETLERMPMPAGLRVVE
jgi:predicted homoserine dehydrogenase-like protein